MLNFADRFQLTLCDAACLELAVRRDLPLSAVDDELRTAAAVLGPRLVVSN